MTVNNLMRAAGLTSLLGACLSAAALGHDLNSLGALALLGLFVLANSAIFSHRTNPDLQPSMRMKAGIVCRLAHLITMLGALTSPDDPHPITKDMPVVIRCGTTFHPLGTIFAAVLGGERTLVLDSVGETTNADTRS